MGTFDSHKVVLRGGKEIEFSKETWEIVIEGLTSEPKPSFLLIRDHYIPLSSIIWAGPKPDPFVSSENEQS